MPLSLILWCFEMASPFYAIRNFFRGPGAPPIQQGLQSGLPAYPTTVNREVTFDTAMQISAVWAAVRLISETVASMPFEIYERDSTGKKRVASGDVRDVLKYYPNNYQTPVEFWESIVLNLAISGNAYAIKQRSGNRITGFVPISSSQVETELVGSDIVHRYTTGSNVRVFAQDSVWHIKLFGNGIVGMSPLSYANDAINIAQNADNRVNKIYSNGAKPGGILMVDKLLEPEQRATIRNNFKGLSEGDDDRLFVLEADMKYQQVSMSPQDIQLLDSRRFQIEDIGRFFGVPSILLNQTTGQSSLGSNVYEIMQAFYKLNLRPYLEKIESSVVRWLYPTEKRRSIEARFDFDALIRADAKTRKQANREAIYSGQLTPNEAREDEGRPPLPGGDVLLIQGATVPLERQIAEPQTPEPLAVPQMEDNDEQSESAVQD